jgi:hypothetical protein
MMRLYRVAGVVVLTNICLAGMAIADDLPQFRPDWRGAAGSTYQQWEFSDNDSPDPAEIHTYNCTGQLTHPTAVFAPGVSWGVQFGGRNGVRTIDADTNESITLEIDNCNPVNPYKEVWMQVTYFLGDFSGSYPYEEPLIDVLAGGAAVTDLSDRNDSEVVHVTEPYYGSWVCRLYKFRIEPNPTEEQILISPPTQAQNNQSKIDQVVVDTICVPEPATLGLLALGGFALIRRRRKA